MRWGLIGLLLVVGCAPVTEEEALAAPCGITVPQIGFTFLADSVVRADMVLYAECPVDLLPSTGTVMPAHLGVGNTAVRWEFHNNTGMIELHGSDGSFPVLIHGPLNPQLPHLSVRIRGYGEPQPLKPRVRQSRI